jgi:hypothetical protein
MIQKHARSRRPRDLACSENTAADQPFPQHQGAGARLLTSRQLPLRRLISISIRSRRTKQGLDWKLVR